jgi:hypothetical protein
MKINWEYVVSCWTFFVGFYQRPRASRIRVATVVGTWSVVGSSLWVFFNYREHLGWNVVKEDLFPLDEYENQL